MIEQFEIPVTILRTAYFMDSDASLKVPLQEYRVYLMLVGSLGLSLVDHRDITNLSAAELFRRPRCLGRPTTAVVPDRLTGTAIAAIWSDVLGHSVTYGGDTRPLEETLKTFAPG
ncbi:NmrA family NAD(P)-binding protein [Microvirga sp. GCM10011540]|uniref:NmrA family NAD(P)-binding protein n=1 Tax=Microvirga sp. GCM10011540 TaxID=3317338 RepID=UPI003619C188